MVDVSLRSSLLLEALVSPEILLLGAFFSSELFSTIKRAIPRRSLLSKAPRSSAAYSSLLIKSTSWKTLDAIDSILATCFPHLQQQPIYGLSGRSSVLLACQRQVYVNHPRHSRRPGPERPSPMGSSRVDLRCSSAPPPLTGRDTNASFLQAGDQDCTRQHSSYGESKHLGTIYALIWIE